MTKVFVPDSSTYSHIHAMSKEITQSSL